MIAIGFKPSVIFLLTELITSLPENKKITITTGGIHHPRVLYCDCSIIRLLENIIVNHKMDPGKVVYEVPKDRVEDFGCNYSICKSR